MKSLKQTYKIHAQVARVWQALVDPNIIEKWSGGPAIMDENVGTKFSLWGGDIHGTNTKVIKNKFLEQDWFGGQWTGPSKLKFLLKKVSDTTTEVELVQDDIPDHELDDIDDGWKRYYMGPLKELLEK